MSGLRWLLVSLVLTEIVPTRSYAQRYARVALTAPGIRGTPGASPRDSSTVGGGRSLSFAAHVSAARATWLAPLSSAVVPGAGQAIIGQDRFVAYLAVESYAWLQFAADVSEGRREQRQFQAVARNVARAYYSDVRPNGDWDYYERMEHYVESGVYDAVPGGALEPESDPATYNGSVWLLARQTYWEDLASPPVSDSPAYQSAIDFYQRRAIRPEYRWSWRNAQLEQDAFRRDIARSNDAFRRSVEDLAIVIGNHALSTVDAYVSVRLRGRSGTNGYSVSSSLPFATVGMLRRLTRRTERS